MLVRCIGARRFCQFTAIHCKSVMSLNLHAMQRVIYTESHDEVVNGKSRVPEEIWPGHADRWFSRKRSTLGATMVFTAPGIPMIFQGQEFLEDGFFQDTDPLNWGRLRTFGGIHLLYRDLIRLRRNWFNHTRGLRGQHINVHHVNNAEEVIAFHRWEHGGPGDDVVVVANFAIVVMTAMPSAGHEQVNGARGSTVTGKL